MQQNEIFPCFVDSSGNVVVKYIYDAWGNHAVVNASGEDIGDATHIGNRNPIRYRGYYYDTETGLYYLKTRYYDPEVGRFISIDDISYLDPETVNGLNLYAYCGNNPVMRVDPNGTSWKSFLSRMGNFFTRDIPNWWNNSVVPFFTQDIPNWWNNRLIPVGQSIKFFFTQTIPETWDKVISSIESKWSEFKINLYKWYHNSTFGNFVIGLAEPYVSDAKTGYLAMLGFALALGGFVSGNVGFIISTIGIVLDIFV